ncbi:fimbrial biogenesis usher protein [Moellerella wisconsensis]|uniref:fimbrial biogenesis usher protein n=1 Tax=Moellerella wisconsensis TaxID=158849 RepID=UPI0009E381A4|nr:fimbrial biogenesis usher protein [Moellerella wisconsensis]
MHSNSQSHSKKTEHWKLAYHILFRPLPYLLIFSGLILTVDGQAAEFFNPALLSGEPGAVADLSRFENGEGQAPGTYRVDIYLNRFFVGTQDVNFEVAPVGQKGNDSGLQPCFTRHWLEQHGVNIAVVPGLESVGDDACINVVDVIPQAQTEFDFERQTLVVSIPQAMLKNNYRGYIPPEQWDEGILAGLLNYRFSGSHSKNTRSNINNTNYFLNVISGLNFGGWRVRNEGTWNHIKTKGQTEQHWNNIRTYVQRAIVPLKSILILGDNFTDSDIFDSVGFRGARLSSDDNMLPDSLRGFAPTIRGIANSNAQVTIEQNGYVIYQTYVPPGAFEIQDLYPTSNSGDLKVIVKEADGTSNEFAVPYSAVPLLQREGRLKYAITAGEYRSGSPTQEKPRFAQATMLLGLKANWTVYQGIQIAENYQAFSLGVGKNLGKFGAFSVDITHSNSQLPDGSRPDGQSLRFLYAKSLNEMGTNFQLLGYRYSTKGFYSFAETAYTRMKGYRLKTQDGPVEMSPEILDYHNLYYTKKGRLQANISQQLGDLGSVYVMGSYQTYWNSSEADQLLQVGYNGNWDGINFNMNASVNKNPGMSERDKRVAISVSLPLNRWINGGGKSQDITYSGNSAYATYTATYDQDHKVSQQAGVSGTLLADNNLNYNVQQGYVTKGEGASGNASLDYRGGYGNASVGYGYGKHWQQVNYGASGGAVVHGDGITLSQPLSETNVLVKAPGATGVSVENATGVKTDWRGYAVVPYATAYRENRVGLNTNTLGEDMDVDGAVSQVVPTEGAIVRAEFTTRIGQRALLTLRQSNGQAVPFGAMVNGEHQGMTGIVGDDGQVFLSGLAPSGELTVIWGSGSHQKCQVSYQLPNQKTNTGLTSAIAQCG